jgi:hypothetical protein
LSRTDESGLSVAGITSSGLQGLYESAETLTLPQSVILVLVTGINRGTVLELIPVTSTGMTVD